jgi:hypothetical protein
MISILYSIKEVFYMKKLFLILFSIMIGLSATASAKTLTTHSPSFVTTIADSTEILLYVLFPDAWGEWYVSEVLPTSAKGTANRGTRFSYPTDVTLVMEPTTIAGATDSLMHYLTPLVWDGADQEFAEIVYDSTCLQFGTRQDYISANKSYLDWTSGQEYHCPLLTWSPYISTTTDAIYWPVCGFVLHIRFVDASGGSMTYALTISGVFEEF